MYSKDVFFGFGTIAKVKGNNSRVSLEIWLHLGHERTSTNIVTMFS